MPPPRTVLPAVVVFGALTLAGCTQTAPGDAQAGGQQTADPPAGGQATAPSGRIELSGYTETHPGGTTVAVHAIEVDDDGHIYVEIEAVANTRRRIGLAHLSTMLVDDRGNRYRFVQPDDNPSLRLGVDERLEATLAFEGPIDPDARRVSLGLNAAMGELRSAEDKPSVLTAGPPFTFADLLLPGVGLDDEAVADGGAGDDPLPGTRTVEVGVSQTSEITEGVTVTVVRITADPRTVHIDLEVDNSSDRRIELLRQNPILKDGHGSRFSRVRQEDPEDEEERILRLSPGEDASATVAFRGVIHPAATELRLVLNPGWGRPHPPAPTFVFEGLPVPRPGGSPGPNAGPTPSPPREGPYRRVATDAGCAGGGGVAGSRLLRRPAGRRGAGQPQPARRSGRRPLHIGG